MARRTDSGCILRCVENKHGYTLVELIVALLVFAVGGLALASTSALLGRGLNTDAVRERAARIAGSQIEMLAASCRSAADGGRSYPGIRSDWTVSHPDANTIEIHESVGYESARAHRTDVYRVLIGCP